MDEHGKGKFARAEGGTGLFWAALALVLDQATKLAVVAWAPLGEPVAVLPFLNLLYVYNEGISFSLLSGTHSWILSAASLVVIALVAWTWLRNPTTRLGAAGYGMIIGGAIGNLIDRIFRDAVVDFVQFHLGDWSFAVFNVADSAITLGVVALLIDMFFLGGDRKKEAGGE